MLRLFYGMLTREGLRVGELAGLEVSDFDLENGILVLDENKTDEPRQWAMATGTTEALRRYLDGFHPCPRPESRMFLFTPHTYAPEYVTDCLRLWCSHGIGVNALGSKLGVSGATISNVVNGCKAPGPRVIDSFAEALQNPSLPHVPQPLRERTDGRPLVALARATEFRANLELAGIRRPQLFELNATRRHIVIHDLRATFVTVHMALGKSEAWITDRTGHTSSSMLHKYKRAARSHQELGLGPLCPLNQALPELRQDAAAPVGAAFQAPNLAVTRQLTDDSGDDMSIYNHSAAAREGLQRQDSNLGPGG